MPESRGIWDSQHYHGGKITILYDKGWQIKNETCQALLRPTDRYSSREGVHLPPQKNLTCGAMISIGDVCTGATCLSIECDKVLVYEEGGRGQDELPALVYGVEYHDIILECLRIHFPEWRWLKPEERRRDVGRSGAAQAIWSEELRAASYEGGRRKQVGCMDQTDLYRETRQVIIKISSVLFLWVVIRTDG